MSDTAMQNLRDVGGVPVAGGGHVRSGLLYRGDAPLDGDVDGALDAWPPRTVVDLRSSGELAPVHPLIAAGAQVHHRPLSANLAMADIAAGSPVLAGGRSGLYGRTLRDAGAVVAEVAAVVADAPGPILVHCAAGKDRTGIVIAAILSAVGVPRAAIVADYVATEANMEGVVTRLSTASQHDAELVAQLRSTHPEAFTAPAAAIEAALDVFDAAAWLQSQGLEPAVVDRLHERLVEAA